MNARQQKSQFTELAFLTAAAFLPRELQTAYWADCLFTRFGNFSLIRADLPERSRR